MKPYIITTFIVVLFISLPAVGQQNVGPADSLRKLLKEKTAEDTSRILLLLRSANATFTSNPDEAMGYAVSAAQLAQKLNWKRGIALSYKVKGGLYYAQSDFVKSLENSQKALTYMTAENAKDKIGTLNNIANVYQDMKEYEKAIPVYIQNRKTAKEFNSKDEEAMAVYGIGSSLHLLKKYDSAILLFNECITLTQQAGNKRTESTVLCALSVTYREMAKYKESGDYAQKSIKLAKESGNNYVLAPALNNLSTALLYLGKYDEAEKYSKESLAIAKEMNIVQWQYQAWDQLSQNYEKRKMTDSAFAAYKNFIQLRDSVLSDEKRQELTRKEIQYEAEKKEAILNTEHTAQLQQQKTIRNSIASGAGILAIGAFISFIFYKKRRDAISGQKEAELKAEISDTEMKALRAQMNPHFIFNSLNSISDYIAKNNTKVADEYLTKFAKLMRLVLENSERKEISLSQDLNALELYMQLECLRMNNKFSYEINIEKSIEADNTLVPPLILQPFVENSIWHGIANKEGHGKIIVSIKKEGNMINCIVEDNGIGRKEAATRFTGYKTENQKSLGMKITRERINVLNKIKNSTAAVKLSDLDEGTKAEVSLPLEKSF